MYQTKKIFITPEMKLADMIFENPSLLLMLEHFDISIVVRDKTVDQLCNEYQISRLVFLFIANLYNGFYPFGVESLDQSDAKPIILFLRNSHRYYLNEKIPDISELIRHLFSENNYPEIRLVEKFFDEYSQEVREHLHYEDVIAFPHFNNLAKDKKQVAGPTKRRFSAKEYLDHHTDIESKLGELKKLLIKHIPLKQDRSLRRKLLVALFELEYDLTIHAAIEELILIPLIKKIERKNASE